MCRPAGTPGLGGWRQAFRPARARAAAKGSSIHLTISIVLVHRPVTLPQIGPAFAGKALSLGQPPPAYPPMIARDEHFGDRAILPEGWSSILRILQQPLGETLIKERIGTSDDPRQEPNTGIDHRDCRGFPARQHKVAKAYLFDGAGFQQAFIDALETAADHAYTRHCCKLAHPLLIEPAPSWRQQNERSYAAGARDCCVEHVRPHHHSRPAAKRCVIDRAVFIARELPDVHRFEPPQPCPHPLAGE